MTSNHLPTAPFVLVDDTTIGHVTAVLERLTGWLGATGPDAAGCTRAL